MIVCFLRLNIVFNQVHPESGTGRVMTVDIMTKQYAHHAILILIAGILILCSACSDSNDSTPVVLNGHLSINEMAGEPTGPLFVAILDKMPADLHAADLDAVLKIISVNPDTLTFSADLGRTTLLPGDTVIIAAFQDKDFSGTPSISQGDIIGFYLNPATFSPEYTIQTGTDSDIEIRVNREVFDFEAKVSGTISGIDTGPVTLIAYAGEISSFDITQYNPDDVIGYTTLMKTDAAVPYTISIMPFGYNIPIKNVSLIAFLDANGNSRIDAGDPVAFYEDDAGLPAVLTITEGDRDGIDLAFSMTVSEPSGFAVGMNGHFDTAAGYESTAGERFVIVMHAADASALGEMALDLSSLSFFYKVPKGGDSFDFDLSATSLAPGDQVMVIALADNDYTGGFPSLTPGDYIGFYQNRISYGNLVALQEGINTIQPSDEWLFEINREVFAFDASLAGTISGTADGAVTLVAYAGEINALDFTKISAQDIIGYTTIDKNDYTVPYSLSILPYGKNIPIRNVYLFAVLDTNANGLNDAGDQIGYVQDDQGLPRLLTITEGNHSGIDIIFSSEIPAPSGHAVTMTGTFDVAEPLTDSPGERFVIISEPSASDNGFPDMDFSSIRYFEKLPHNVRSFEIDLTATGLAPGDDVMVAVLIDNDYSAGFPSVSAGDCIGYYQNTTDFRTAVTLHAGNNIVVPSDEWSFTIDRTWYDHQASIQFELDDSLLNSILVGVELDPGEHVTALAVYEDGVTVGLNPTIDMNYVVGFASVTVPADGNNGRLYEMNILPAIYYGVEVGEPFRIPNVYIVAVFDGNTNDTPEKNNYLGYYWKWEGLLRQITPYPLIEDKKNRLDKSVWFSILKYSL